MLAVLLAAKESGITWPDVAVTAVFLTFCAVVLWRLS